jgi:membrane protein implicated in regulation of membrane protease activity
MRSLLRTQLRLAMATLALVLVPLGLIPLAVHVYPPLAELAVGRVPLSWLLLGAAVYPYLVLVGWRYVRQAERNERAFDRIVSRR